VVKRLTRIAGAVAVVAVASACGASSSGKSASATTAVQHPASLVGVVGHNDAFSISLTDPGGAAIRHLAAGTYSLAIKDESSIHNFHLSGGGVDQKTSIGSTGTSTFSVTFKPGTYTFICDPHSSSMHGDFIVS
jgi:hypothetical protein